MAQLQQRSMEAAIVEEDDADSAVRGTSGSPSIDDDADDPAAHAAVDPATIAAPDALPSHGHLPAPDPPPDSQRAASPTAAQPITVPARPQPPRDAAPQPSPAAGTSVGRGPHSGGGGAGFSWPSLGREHGGSLPSSMLRRQSGSAHLTTQSQVGRFMQHYPSHRSWFVEVAFL